MDLLNWLTLQAPLIFAAILWFGPGWCCPPPCAEFSCSLCEGGVAPLELLVTVADAVDQSGWNSAAWNGSWVVPFFSTETGLCRWRKTFTQEEIDTIFDGDENDSDPPWFLQVDLDSSSPSVRPLVIFLVGYQQNFRNFSNDTVECFDEFPQPSYVDPGGFFKPGFQDAIVRVFPNT